MPPLTLLIKPASSLCNMKCRYCFYANEAENRSVKSYGIMSAECAEQLIKRAYEYADTMCSFVFQGGEPTLAGTEYFKNFVKLCRQYNAKNIPTSFSIQTNGYAISEEMTELFHTERFLVGLSLDGYAEIHDFMRDNSFKKVMTSAKAFEKHHVDFNILSVVNNFSARHGAKIYNFFKKNGFRHLQFIAQIDGFGEKHDFSLTAERYADFLKTVFDLYYADFMSNNYTAVRNFDNCIRIIGGLGAECCGMAGECACNFTVESDGSVYPCDFYVLDEWKIGNVHDDSFEAMKNSPTAKKFVESSKHISRECRECEYFALCLGGCRRLREPFENGLPTLNRFCAAYKKFFPYAMTRMEEMARVCFGKK